jgi:predicted secreted protein
MDKRSRRVAFVAHCLLNQNAKVAGAAAWPAMVTPLVELLSRAEIGIIQLPCPEVAHFGLGRPTGDDTKEQYDCPEYRATCQRLAREVIRELRQYLDGGYEVACVLGVEGSPSCSIATVPTRKGRTAGSGVFFEVLLDDLRQAKIEVAAIGIPEAGDLAATLARVEALAHGKGRQ